MRIRGRRLLHMCGTSGGPCCARGGCRAGLRLRHWRQAVWFDVCVVSSLAADTMLHEGHSFDGSEVVQACVLVSTNYLILVACLVQ